MYAIVKTGGKQYRAEKGATLVVDKLGGVIGDKVELAEVLVISDGKAVRVGAPYVKGARVRAEIVRQARGRKIEAFNYKPKKNVRKRWGHRQQETHLRVTEIETGG